jgi:hypothetical protein
MLRREVLRFPQPDGGLELWDPVFDRRYLLTPAEVAMVDRALPERLAAAMLEEGPLGDVLRTQFWARKRATVLPPPAMDPPADFDWSRAELLPPDRIADAWRDGETWRRLAEDRAAGAQALPMRGLLAPDFALALRTAHEGASFERLDVGLTWAHRHVCTFDDTGAIADWLAVMASEAFRGLMGAVIGLELPASVTANCWLLHPGDEIRPHPVGTTYVATISLGLCPGWTAADLGAIAFADAAPGDEQFRVLSRWLPHLGDGLAIARGPASWHWVESPKRERRTLTGWWVAG